MTAIRIFDIETTGFNPDEDCIVEVAAYDLHDDGRVAFVDASLVKPGRPIPPEASATHHLIDVDVAEAPPLAAVLTRVFANAPTIFAAHNCDFERSFLPTPAGTRWICTYKAALRVWPAAPSHQNQVLRYWRALDTREGFNRALAAPAHRAGPDAYITAWLLADLLQQARLDDLMRWAEEPKLHPRLSFGRHRGKTWAEIPTDYLEWLRDGQHDMDDDWRFGARLELGRRGSAGGTAA
jgi:exodeoxyribonuclease X